MKTVGASFCSTLEFPFLVKIGFKVELNPRTIITDISRFVAFTSIVKFVLISPSSLTRSDKSTFCLGKKISNKKFSTYVIISDAEIYVLST